MLAKIWLICQQPAMARPIGVTGVRSYQRNWHILSSMEFHGTSRVSEIGTLQVPWNSMELLLSAKLAHSKFHWIPWNSMELLVSAKLAHHRINGIPWNFSCHQNWCTPSSMEFHGIPWNFSCHRNWCISMEFHGSARVSEIGAFLVPWNCLCQRY